MPDLVFETPEEQVAQHREWLRKADAEIARLTAERDEWKQAAQVEAGLRREFKEERDRLQKNLNGRDDFLVGKNLWSEFMDWLRVHEQSTREEPK